MLVVEMGDASASKKDALMAGYLADPTAQELVMKLAACLDNSGAVKVDLLDALMVELKVSCWAED